MFKFIFILVFFFFTLLFLLGFSVIRTIMNFFFGSKKQAPQNKSRKQTTHRKQQTRHTNTQEKPRKKLIAEDEGEYVDYEEIK